MKSCFISVVLCLLTACATNFQPVYYYNEIRVVNNTSQILRNFSIRVPQTGAEFSCGNVAPKGLCSNRFEPRRYQHNPIQIEWSYGNRARQLQEFVVPVPARFSTGLALQGIVEVNQTGEIKAYFTQESKFRLPG